MKLPLFDKGGKLLVELEGYATADLEENVVEGGFWDHVFEEVAYVKVDGALLSIQSHKFYDEEFRPYTKWWVV